MHLSVTLHQNRKKQDTDLVLSAVDWIMKTDKINLSLQGQGLCGINDWRSPVCVTREKFTLEDPLMTFQL